MKTKIVSILEKLKPLLPAVLLSAKIAPAAAAVVFTVSPSAISNTYVGPITLQVTGLTGGDTVVVQKFLDANTNGTVDGPDFMVQQFNLTDGTAGMVIGSVTNINVPGDTDGAANGTITAKWNFPDRNFIQNVDGQFIFRLSSPAGHFTTTNVLFNVTNFPFAQRITGNVVSNGTSATLPNAVVILFPPPRGGDNGPGTPLGGTVANNSGAYSVQVPPGTYIPVAFKSNYVANYAGSPALTLTSSQTITTNLPTTNSTTTISGKIVDASNNTIGLPGLFIAGTMNPGLIAFGFTDTNGNFTMPVISGTWSLSGDAVGSIDILGYVGYDNNTNINAGTANITLPFHKATALFYGTVKDNLGNPISGVAIEARDQNDNIYDTDSGYSDANGNYVTAAIGGLSNDPWQLDEDQGGPADYLYASGTNNVTLSAGHVVHYNFTGILATNHITGNVQYNGTNVIGVGVSAYATVGGIVYNVNNSDTDNGGNYSLNVANGTWTVNVYDCGCDDNDSLSSVLNGQNYQDPSSQDVHINNNTGTANFTIPSGGSSGVIFGYVTDSNEDPVSGVTVYASYNSNQYSTSTDGNGYFEFDGVSDGTWDVSVDCGGLNSLGYNCVNDDYATVSGGDSVEADFTAQFSNPPLQINTTSVPNGTNGVYYNVALQASGGSPPYGWYIPNYSAALPAGLSLSNNGTIYGTPAASVGTYYFDAVVTDSVAGSYEQDGLALTIVNPPAPPLTITNVSLPNGNVGVPYNAQLGATGGVPSYFWQLALGSASLPGGLALNSNGLISGTPTNSGLFPFKAQVTDNNSTVTNKVLAIIINPRPKLSLPAWRTNRFSLWLNAASNQSYTLLVSTNLAFTNWSTVLVTNNVTTNSFIVADPNATNKQRFYRVMVGP